MGDRGSNNLFDKSKIASEGICFTSPGFFSATLLDYSETPKPRRMLAFICTKDEVIKPV